MIKKWPRVVSSYRSLDQPFDEKGLIAMSVKTKHRNYYPGGKLRGTHGDTSSAEFRSWQGMKQRCYNQNHHKYHYYGAKGIRVCDRWLQFENFLEDMGRKPSSKHSIDRIDNDGDYEPDNCRWADYKTQNTNRSITAFLTHNGITLSKSAWARKKGMSKGCLDRRLRQGMTVAEALETPVLKRKNAVQT